MEGWTLLVEGGVLTHRFPGSQKLTVLPAGDREQSPGAAGPPPKTRQWGDISIMYFFYFGRKNPPATSTRVTAQTNRFIKDVNMNCIKCTDCVYNYIKSKIQRKQKLRESRN